MADKRVSGGNGAAGAEAARRAAEAARKAAAEAAREAAAAQAAQRVIENRRALTAPLPDQQDVSPNAALERNTGPLGVLPVAEAPDLPGGFEPGTGAPEEDEPTGGGASAGPPPNVLADVSGGLREVSATVGAERGAVIQRKIALKKLGDARTPAQSAELSRLESREVRAETAANLLGLATGVNNTARGFEALEDGDVVGGVTQIAAGGLETIGRGIRLSSNIPQLKPNDNLDTKALDATDRRGSAVSAAADIASGIGDVASGVQALRDGDVVGGGLQVAAGAVGTASGAASLGANLAANGSISSTSGLARLGQSAPTLAGAAGVLGGALAFNRGVNAIRDGKILEGSVQLATGTLGSLAGAGGAIHSLQGVARLGASAPITGGLLKFANAANKFGGAASIIGGGFQAFTALTAKPPNLESAAVGGANIVGGALLMGGATAPAGAAILVGAALFENVAPFRELVKGQVGALINVGEGVVEGVGEVAEGFSDAREELLQGDVAGAASDAARGLVRGGTEVARGLAEGVERLNEGLENAGESIARGAAGLARGAGRVLSNL